MSLECNIDSQVVLYVIIAFPSTLGVNPMDILHLPARSITTPIRLLVKPLGWLVAVAIFASIQTTTLTLVDMFITSVKTIGACACKLERVS